MQALDFLLGFLSCTKKFAGGKSVLGSSNDNSVLWPLVVYGGIVFTLIGAMLGLSYFLGGRHRERATNAPYEGGIISAGDARLRFSSQFYMIPMLLVIFAVETIFIFTCPLAFRDLGTIGF